MLGESGSGRIVWWGVLLICLCTNLWSKQVVLRPDSIPAALPATAMDSVPSVDLAVLAQSMGYVAHWQADSGLLTIQADLGGVVFVKDYPFFAFYFASDTTAMFRYGQCRRKPLSNGVGLSFAVPDAIEALKRVVGKEEAWIKAQNALPILRPYLSGKATGNGEGLSEVAQLPAPLKNQTALATGPRREVVKTMGVSKANHEAISTVVIDPGHGGKDPGAIGPTGVLEKDIVLGIGLALRDRLKKGAFKVYMTRDQDVFIPLQERTRFANEKKADIFLSVHANSIAGNKVKKLETKGYKVYFLSQAKNEEDKLVAMRENAVVELEHKPRDVAALQNIIVEILNNEYLLESQELSIKIDEAFNRGLKRIGKLHLGVGQAPFWVLNGAYMPAVLVEVGFISNPQEESFLTDPAIQKAYAESLFEAVMAFKQQFEAQQ